MPERRSTQVRTSVLGVSVVPAGQSSFVSPEVHGEVGRSILRISPRLATQPWMWRNECAEAGGGACIVASARAPMRTAMHLRDLRTPKMVALTEDIP
jgi:hypothetical protein